MDRDQTIDFHIKTAWHAIFRMYNQQAKKYEGTTTLGFVLLNIPREGVHATKIGPLMGMESRSLTRTLKTMEEKGLIYKVKDEEDRRSVRIFLTDEGVKKRDIASKTVKDFNNVVRTEIPEDKLKIFIEVIRDINGLIEKNRIYNHHSKLIENEQSN